MPLSKELPFSPEVFHDIAEHYRTPIYVYDEAGIRGNAQTINKAFHWSPGYINHFAVKATPTPGILRLIEQEGMGFDCSSAGELLTMYKNKLGEHGIFYTSNNTPNEDYILANWLGATINIDKQPYVQQVHRALGRLPTRMSIRYNPGQVKSGNDIIGNPVNSKFGATEKQVIEAMRQMRSLGVEQLGLHTMVVSNETNPDSFAETARLLRQLAEKALELEGIELSFINVGGGIGISYHPEDVPVDVEGIGEAIESELGCLNIPIISEYGRYITGPHGYLLTRVTHGIQENYEPYLEIDSSINNMARLATVTAAYHHINILGRDGDSTRPLHITGSMCANTDKMFKWRDLPETVQPGDLVVIHDAGAHSRANSHNYNDLRRAGEVIVRPDGSHYLVRRHETIRDVHATTEGL